MIWLVAIVTMAAFRASGAKAAFMDGELLHRLCENSPSEATAYSIGIADSLQWIEAAQDDPENLDIRLCIPRDVGAPQIKDATCEYLVEHPESLQLPAATLVGLALYAKWLCSS